MQEVYLGSFLDCKESIYVFLKSLLKFIHSEKATKIGRNLQIKSIKKSLEKFVLFFVAFSEQYMNFKVASIQPKSIKLQNITFTAYRCKSVNIIYEQELLVNNDKVFSFNLLANTGYNFKYQLNHSLVKSGLNCANLTN